MIRVPKYSDPHSELSFYVCGLILPPREAKKRVDLCSRPVLYPLRSENGAENRKNDFLNHFWVFRHTIRIPVGILTGYFAPNHAGDAREKNHRLWTSETANHTLLIVWLLQRISDLWNFRNLFNFEKLYLRAQEELEARTKCVVKALTWSLRTNKNLVKLLSQQKVIVW